MRIVDSIKQGQERLESLNTEFKHRVESRIKSWPEAWSKTVADLRNFSLPSVTQYFHFFHDTESASDVEEQLASPKLSIDFQGLYQRIQAQLDVENYVGEWFHLTQDHIQQFANVTGDQQWIHTDPERAESESPFKSTIAHGFLTLSLIPTLTDTVNPENNEYPEARLVVNCGMNKVVFPAPVKAGKQIRARSRVIAVQPIRRGIELVREVTIEIENSKRPACVAELVMRLYQ
jgi:acyl dehydratase